MFSPNYPASPVNNRSVGSSPFRGPASYSSGAAYSTGKFSRGLQSAFNNAASLNAAFGSYQPGDRYHWINKSIVKA
jgi:hypothetical protein